MAVVAHPNCMQSRAYSSSPGSSPGPASPPAAPTALTLIPLGKVLTTDFPTRRRRFFIRVGRLDQADAIVANRRTQLAIFDELSPEERATHRLLWPTFVEARRLGLTAQFSRANLTVSKRKVDGAILQRYTIWP